MQTNQSETMWPERIAAIYEQFPWLEKIFSQDKVDRAYVKRFDENRLDVHTEARWYTYCNSADLEYKFHEKVSAWLVDKNGAAICLGKRTEEKEVKRFFWKPKLARKMGYFDETLRHGIQSLPADSLASFVVLIQRSRELDALNEEPSLGSPDDCGSITHLTVFKSPQNGVTLKQWYDTRAASIKKAVTAEVEDA